MITKVLTSAVVLILLVGCATTPRGANYTPVVDMKDKDSAAYSTDLTQCSKYANERAGAAAGAAVGALLVGLLGAALAPSGYRNQVARQGVILGGVAGAGNAVETQETIIKRCLAGRGYNVLN